MPISEKLLGFSNRWYDLAIETAVERELGSGARIRAVSPPVVIATKLAAWRGRGNDDVLRSLDVHDIVVWSMGDDLAAVKDKLHQLKVRSSSTATSTRQSAELLSAVGGRGSNRRLVRVSRAMSTQSTRRPLQTRLLSDLLV